MPNAPNVPNSASAGPKPSDPPPNSFRIVLELASAKPRIDQVLLAAIRLQGRSLALREISRIEFKALFKAKRVRIKGQPAVPSSSLAAGVTVVDILGFTDAP